MQASTTYTFTSQEFGKMSKLADIVYNVSNVIEQFCLARQEIEEIAYLTPVVANLRDKADSLNYIFLSALDSDQSDHQCNLP